VLSLLIDAAYLLLLMAASPWLAWQAVRKGKYREGFAAKFWGAVPRRTSERRCVWLHAVSVGEVNLLVPLVAEIERRWPDCDCVISTTTMTGMALARSRFARLSVFYCPLDFSFAVRRALRRIRPDLVVLAELELWPNLIAAARRADARVAIVNGRLSERSLRGYLRIRPLVARTLARIDLIAAQTDQYAQRFKAIGARDEAVRVTGSIKFDGASSDRKNPETLRLRSLAGIADGDDVLLAGSTQEPEEALALAAFCRLKDQFPRLKLVLVPRHPERFGRVADLLAGSGLLWQRRTDLDVGPADASARILLVDKIGELKSWWGAAHIAFVGGSIGSRGGQNMIEPAAYGCAVSFGPNTQNFRDVVGLLLAADAAVVVHDGAELTAFVEKCLRDSVFATDLGARAQRVVLSQLGATARTVDLLAELFPTGTVASSRQQAAA
jgi:3-deoxy-D-manno-octulosonic-acid transferase